MSMDFSSIQGRNRVILLFLIWSHLIHLHHCFLLCFQELSQRNEVSSDVGVVGQRVIYSKGAIRTEEETPGMPPPLVKPEVRDSVRALKPPKGQSNRDECLSQDSPGNTFLCS